MNRRSLVQRLVVVAAFGALDAGGAPVLAGAGAEAAIAAHAGNASLAAWTAASTSAAPDAGTCPITAPVAGLTTSSVAPSTAGRQSPPMKLESSEDSVVAIRTECHASDRDDAPAGADGGSIVAGG